MLCYFSCTSYCFCNFVLKKIFFSAVFYQWNVDYASVISKRFSLTPERNTRSEEGQKGRKKNILFEYTGKIDVNRKKEENKIFLKRKSNHSHQLTTIYLLHWPFISIYVGRGVIINDYCSHSGF